MFNHSARILLSAVALLLSSASQAAEIPVRAKAERRMALQAQWATRTAADPALAAIVDLLALERLYRQQHKPVQALQMYTEVLASTDHLIVRNFVERRIARLQWRSGDSQAAEATLQRNLQHNLQQAAGR